MKRQFTRWLLTIAALSLAAPAFALNDTPAPTPAGTSTPAASPAAAAGKPREQQRPSNGNDVFQGPDTFEGGVQVGKTSDGGSLLTFMKGFTCTVNPVAMTLPGQTTTVGCAAPGARTGDFVSCRMGVGNASGAIIHGVSAATDVVSIEFVALSDQFADLAALTLSCVVVGTTAR